MNETPRKRHLSESNSSNNFKRSVTDILKENVPPEFSDSTDSVDTKVGLQNSVVDNGLESTTPKKSHQNLEDPVTPNTNFKLLTTVAAACDYANCTPKSNKNYEIFENELFMDCGQSDLSAIKVNRKEKSLAIICKRFLSMFPNHPPSHKKIIVSLDDVSIKLGVERRRLYDIVNVFESIDILTKNAKNQYLWFGKNNLLISLRKLKVAAVKENMLEKLQYVLRSECVPSCKQYCILSEVQNFNKSLEAPESSPFPVSCFPELRKEKSLGIMSQKFLMLFLVSPSKIISLGVAAKVLNGFHHRDEKSAQIKTQVRRLYDIANVLSSIGLIQKEAAVSHHVRKPAFKYIGPNLSDYKVDIPDVGKPSFKSALKGNNSRSLARHSSFQDICAVAEIEHQKLNLKESHNSAPPFDTLLAEQKENCKTDFENLNFNIPDTKNVKVNSDLSEAKPPSALKSNLKVINFAKSTPNSAMPCFIVNNIPADKVNVKYSNSTFPAQTFFVINTVAPTKEVKVEAVQNQPISQISNSQTTILSQRQRDAILQSLNVSLSPEQIAVIQLDGASVSSPDSNSSNNVLKIISKNDAPKATESKSNDIKASTQKDMEFIANVSSVSSTRNSSPNSVQTLDSPLSIPSGYVTPIPIPSSDIPFVSNVEVNDILKKIENQPNCDAVSKVITSQQDCLNVSCLTSSCPPIIVKENIATTVKNKELVDNRYLVNSIKNSNCSTDQANQLILNDSCSNDSVNLEVSNIFKGKNLGDTKSKPFLIDEKTILSPIKKNNVLPQIQVPVNLITPPYILPDTIFVFSTPARSYQSAPVSSSLSQTTVVPK